ncbi:MAG TPA: UbiA family prenyltransferase [Gemmatimonadota bacterium]|nr:UbiA family prenyltransferase [Gemmatimonadota bacterium]
MKAVQDGRLREMGQALLHLRFPFVFVLSPIFVWGALGAAGWTARTTLGFLLVHLALYPGANAFNTAYDRDTGPIGGLARPPAVPRGLAGGSTALQAAGAALAPLVGWTFGAAYVALWGIFTAYSHPRTRWKRSPWLSGAAIVGGQGGLGWLLGWTAAGGRWPPSGDEVWSLVAASAAVAALYPFTQVYQLEADLSRRDRTLAAALGVRGTLAWGGAWFLVVALCGRALGLPVVAVYAALVAALALAAAAVRGRSAPSHRAVMGVAYANSALLLAFMAAAW